ncbi:unnamed protein product [Amoebophrya sp. A25]|nr:unnamed protein product [Amoebophrya sp. A25]|eukprot:GSA25T00013361001.1
MAPLPLPPFFATVGKLVGPIASRFIGPALTRFGVNRVSAVALARVSARLAPLFRRSALVIAEQARERVFLNARDVRSGLLDYERRRLIAEREQSVLGAGAPSRSSRGPRTNAAGRAGVSGNGILGSTRNDLGHEARTKSSTDLVDPIDEMRLEAKRRISAAFSDTDTDRVLRRSGVTLDSLAKYNEFILARYLPEQNGVTGSASSEVEKSLLSVRRWINKAARDYVSPVYSVARLPARSGYASASRGGVRAGDPHQDNWLTRMLVRGVGRRGREANPFNMNEVPDTDPRGLERLGRFWANIYYASLLFPGALVGLVVVSALEEQEEKFPDQTRRWRLCLVSPEQERELGSEGASILRQNHSATLLPYTHPLHKEIEILVRKLLHQNCLPRNSWKEPAPVWRVHVVKDPDICNAMVLPDGSIFVYTGLLERCYSEDEVATVLGHEISHVLLRHGAEQLSSAEVLSVPGHFLQVCSLLAGGLSYVLLSSSVQNMVGGLLLELPQSRFCEQEADELGLRISTLAGYDPLAAPKLWARMGDSASPLATDEEASRKRGKNNELRDYVKDRLAQVETQKGACTFTSKAILPDQSSSVSGSVPGLLGFVFPSRGQMYMGHSGSGGDGASQASFYDFGSSPVVASTNHGRTESTRRKTSAGSENDTALRGLTFFPSSASAISRSSTRETDDAVPSSRPNRRAVVDALRLLHPHFTTAFLTDVGLLTEDTEINYGADLRLRLRVPQSQLHPPGISTSSTSSSSSSSSGSGPSPQPCGCYGPSTSTGLSCGRARISKSSTPSFATVPTEWFSTHPSYESRVTNLLDEALYLREHPMYQRPGAWYQDEEQGGGYSDWYFGGRPSGSQERRREAVMANGDGTESRGPASERAISLRNLLGQLEAGLPRYGGTRKPRDLEEWCEELRRETDAQRRGQAISSPLSHAPPPPPAAV